ncbi:hypothetical protein BDW67DRAFT_150739 [Aspergillus spinulosporus]
MEIDPNSLRQPENLSGHLAPGYMPSPMEYSVPGGCHSDLNNPSTGITLDGPFMAQAGPHDSSPPGNDGDSYKARRKEQNRLAQKAFRERKEQYIRILERKVNQLREQTQMLEEDNRQLRRDIVTLLPRAEPSGQDVLASPLLSQERDALDLARGGLADWPAHLQLVRVSRCSREKLLNVQNTCELIQTVWGLIQSHELFEKGIIDIGDVYSRLKEIALSKGDRFNLQEGVDEILRHNATKNNDFLL